MWAIETHYRGYRFRSRLEARWAVYFDALHLQWEYEKEGYRFGCGTRYLPDFWLPQVSMWAEVKQAKFTLPELKKVTLLVKGSGFPCILLDGPPDLRSYGVVSWEFDQVIIGEPGGWDCVISNYHNYPIEEHRFYCSTGGLTDRDFEHSGMFDDVSEAVGAARAARFEFGECGYGLR